jgi:hypothetical protein
VSGTISYPFDPEISLALNFIMEEVERLGNYRSAAVDITDADYPTTSDVRTVFFVDAGGATDFLEYRVNRAPEARSTLVVSDGNLAISDSTGAFRDVIIVTGDEAGTGRYDSGDNGNVDGFVVASGDMTIHNSVSPATVTGGLATRPGFYSVRPWSWRELYE